MTSLPRRDSALLRLEFDDHFQPCEPQDGDEIYPNGIFEFNVTRLLAHIRTSGQVRAELIPLHDIPATGSSAALNAATVAAADLSRPIVFAEIAPGRFNLIDGHHRVAKARCRGVANILAYRVRCPDHVAFLTSARAYKSYVEYWNSKVDDACGTRPGRRRTPASRPAHKV